MPQNFGSKDNFQHFCKQLYSICILVLVQRTFIYYAAKNDLYRRMSAKDWRNDELFSWRWEWLLLRIYYVEQKAWIHFSVFTRAVGWPTSVHSRFLSCWFLWVRYGVKTRLACTVAKAVDSQLSKMLTVVIQRVLIWDVLCLQWFCINLGPFLSTAQRIEKDFTRHVYWCKANLHLELNTVVSKVSFMWKLFSLFQSNQDDGGSIGY